VRDKKRAVERDEVFGGHACDIGDVEFTENQRRGKGNETAHSVFWVIVEVQCVTTKIRQ